MSRIRIILSASVCSLALSGCIPAAAGLALTAASLVTGGGGNGGKGGEGFTNPIDRQTTGRQIRQALSRMNDQVDPACQAMLDEHQKTHGTVTAGKAVESMDPAPEKPGAADSETPTEATPDGTPKDTAETAASKAPPPVNLLAKLEPDGTDVSVSADAASDSAADPVSPVGTTETATPSDTETGSAAAADPEVKPVQASLGTKSSPAPGHCEHRFVCLPGTPKPTLMLMCPGKGGKLEPEKTMASSDTAATPTDPDQASPADNESQTATHEEVQTTASALKQGTATDTAPNSLVDGTGTAAGVGAATAETPVVDTSVSADTAPGLSADSAPRTIENGGVADWNWSYDPAKQL